MHTCTIKMSDQGAKGALLKRHSVLKTNKWITENDKALGTTVWLKYDTDPADCTHVKMLLSIQRPAHWETELQCGVRGRL